MTITIRVTPPKSPASKTPEARPAWAKISPTSPRGTMPDADHGLVAAEPERSEAGGQFAGDAGDDKTPPITRANRLAGSKGLRAPQVDRCSDGDEEEGHEEMADLGDAALDLTDLRSRPRPAGRLRTPR